MMEIEDIKAVCRTCLSRVEKGTSIFQPYENDAMKFSEILQSCTGIDVSDDERYPDIICQNCAIELPAAWRFVIMCRTSNQQLHKYFIEGMPLVKLEIKEEFTAQSVKSDKDSDDDFDDSNAVDFKLETAEDLEEEELGRRKPGRRYRGKGRKTKAKILNFRCPLCDHASETSCRLKKHFKKSHPEDMDLICKYICEHCEKAFKRKSDIIVHMRIHTGEKPFACDYCPKRFAQVGAAMEHMRRHTGEMPYKCPACPKYFIKLCYLKRHSVVHTKIRAYSCELCGKTFSTSSILNQHRMVHSDERKHSCHICGSKMKSLYNWRIHMQIHQGVKYVCEICGKNFNGKSNLAVHMKNMHSNIAGKCLECNKDTSNLEEHMKMHDSVNHYKCRLCSKTFNMRRALKTHMTLHTNSHKYRCEAAGCGKGFPKHHLLDFHVRKMHSNESFTKCPYCSTEFFRKSDLSRHINTLHAQQKNEASEPCKQETS